MSKLHGIARAAKDDLRSQVHFCPKTGQIWLHEHRMLLVHAEAQALLRKELIDSLGIDRARGLLTRLGYASGVRDAELARARSEGCTDEEAFMTGPRLHALEGIVQVTPVRLELDRMSGRFYGEFLWVNSWEGQWHRHHYGVHAEPVCWTQIGYACGYASAFMGRSILFKETECTGMGQAQCRIVGRPVEEWDDAAEHLRYFAPDSIADQLIEQQTQVGQLRSTIAEKDQLPAGMTGISPGFSRAFELLRVGAGSQITVLLSGETGVGKELFARALHAMGARRDHPFVAVNCAAIPAELLESELFGAERGAHAGAQAARAGRFERADGGSLFLDEIGELPLPAQSRLMRMLQDGEIERVGGHRARRINVRIIAATNAELDLLVKEGRFRSDLHHRLNPFQIHIPPLRERKEDIPFLARRFLEEHCATHGKKLRGFTGEAERALLAYRWPGNIRELRNMVERGVILAPSGTRIEVDHLFCSPGAEPQAPVFGLGRSDSARWVTGKELCEAVFNGVRTLDQVEAMLIETAVDKAHGNLSAASRMLGLTRPQLAYRLKRLHEAAAAAGGVQLKTEPEGRAPAWP